MSPWENTHVQKGNGVVLLTPIDTQKNIVEIETEPGEVLIFDPNLISIHEGGSLDINRSPGIFKSIGARFTLPVEFKGTRNHVSLYNLVGELVHESYVEGLYVDFTRYIGKTQDIYMVKVSDK